MTHDIKFENWYILPPPPVVARQYDNLSRTLNVVGDLPDGYTWDMLVRCGGNMDIIRLSPTETGVGVALTTQQLALAGDYSMQLRGTLGDVVQHTNVITVVIPESISGAAEWPDVPSEFTQLEQRISEIASHPPIPGDDGFWEIWNPETDEYEPSEFPLPSTGGGTGGTTDYRRLTNKPRINGVELVGDVSGEDLNITGEPGPQGPEGPAGPQGENGEQGEPGPKGEK